MPIGHALPLARELVRALGQVPGVIQVEAAGSIRRMKDTVGDIDLLATSARPERKTSGGMPVTDTEIAQAVRRTLKWDARRRQRRRE